MAIDEVASDQHKMNFAMRTLLIARLCTFCDNNSYLIAELSFGGKSPFLAGLSFNSEEVPRVLVPILSSCA